MHNTRLKDTRNLNTIKVLPDLPANIVRDGCRDGSGCDGPPNYNCRDLVKPSPAVNEWTDKEEPPTAGDTLITPTTAPASYSSGGRLEIR